jgi:hypothetical protein
MFYTSNGTPVEPVVLFLAWLVSAAINGVVGIIIGSHKEGTTASHFWSPFVFGVFGLCWVASKRDEALSDYLGGAIDLLQARVAELEARLDVVSPETKGKTFTHRTSNSRMAPLSRASASTPPRSGPADDATRRGYRKVCPKCKRSYGMKDEECETCHVRLSVVNERILRDE